MKCIIIIVIIIIIIIIMIIIIILFNSTYMLCFISCICSRGLKVVLY